MLDTSESRSLTGVSNTEESETMQNLQKMFKGLETVNWIKLSHDVFRAPNMSLLLSSLIGLGS